MYRRRKRREGVDAYIRVGFPAFHTAGRRLLIVALLAAASLAAIFVIATSAHNVHLVVRIEIDKQSTPPPVVTEQSPETRPVIAKDQTYDLPLDPYPLDLRGQTVVIRDPSAKPKPKIATGPRKRTGSPLQLDADSINRMAEVMVIPYGFRGYRVLICRNVPIQLADDDGHTTVCSVAKEQLQKMK
jgi:hypothetical protein